MIVGPVISLLLSYFVLVSGASIEPRAAKSTDQPVDVPYDIDEFTQAASLAQQAYCTKGAHDYGLKIGDSTLLWTTGDGSLKQRVNVHHSDSLGIVVAFQGTNSISPFSDFHDIQFRPVDPDARYKQYYPKGTKVMNGFQNAYTDDVDTVFKHVEKFKQEKNETRVTVTGHSLGAAMGLLGSMDIALRMNGGLHKAYLFGLPRVGNPTFADFVDKTIGDRLHWVVNGGDWVPLVPPRPFGYQHPSNYIWIYPSNSDNWRLYPGQENVHGMLTVPQDVGTSDHLGVYFHSKIGGRSGPCPSQLGGY